MFRRIAPFLAALGALLLPASADAHHLDQDTSKIACVLVANVPKVQVTAHYVDFSRWDQPVYRSTKIDDVIVPEGTGDIPIWSDPDYFDRISVTVAPGQHDVRYDATWNQGDNYGGIRRQVICPTPVPPPPPPPPPPCPPGSMPDVVSGRCITIPPPPSCPPGKTYDVVVGLCRPVPPSTPPPKPCPCRPHPKPKPHRVSCKIGYFNHDPLPGAHVASVRGCRIRVVHPHRTHGRQVFAVSCSGRVVRGTARWYVDGKRVRNHHWTHTTHGGKHLSSYLFDQKVWGHFLWGQHTVSVSVRTA